MELSNLLSFLTSPSIYPCHIYLTTTLLPENRVQFSYPIFQRVTHLTLIWCQTDSSSEGEGEADWDTLQGLNSLTHLAIYTTGTVRRGFFKRIGTIVSLCPESLRVFIFWISGAWNYSQLSSCVDEVRSIYEGQVDMRVVIGSTCSPTANNWVDEAHAFRRSLSDWLRDCAGISKGKSFWALAEDMIEERSRRNSFRGTDLGFV